MANQNGQNNELKHGAIGGIALVFLVIAAAAPLGASATNTPLIFMLGNGPAAAFDFVIIGILLLLFRYSWKENWKAFLLVNMLTQGLLAVASSSVTAHSGVSGWYLFFFFLPAELVVMLVEVFLYSGRGLLTGHSKGRAAAYAITANLASAVLGYYLAEPVWRLVVSIL